MLQCIVCSCDRCEFSPFPKGHWQSPGTALVAGKLSPIRAVQGDCEGVYDAIGERLQAGKTQSNGPEATYPTVATSAAEGGNRPLPTLDIKLGSPTSVNIDVDMRHGLMRALGAKHVYRSACVALMQWKCMHWNGERLQYCFFSLWRI